MDRDGTDLVCPQCGRIGPGPLGALCPIDASAMVTPEVKAALAERRDPIIGRVIAGRFPVVGLIGRGAYGTVYRAVQLPIGREVALKVMNTPRNEELRSRFFREARVVARLSHPSTVTLFDYGQDDDGLLYMVLELIRGETLRDVVRDEAPLAPARAARLTLQILGALVEAHQIGLIHRDLKPANIMLAREKTGEERAKVLDFGMAKVLEGQGLSSSDEATRTGLVVGTPRYLSPEQAMAREVGPPTDVYALGVVLFEMLAGEPPFKAPSTFELLVLHTTAEVPRLDPVLDVPAEMEAVLRRAMAKQVDDRFSDAQGMLDALRQASRGAPTASMAPRRVKPPGPTPTSGVEKLTTADLKAVARRTSSLVPSTTIASDLRSDAPGGDPPTETDPDISTEPAPPPPPFRPETSSLEPPPLDIDALDHGPSAAHGEITDLQALDAPAGGRKLGVLAVVIVAALGITGWMLLDRPSPEPEVAESAMLRTVARDEPTDPVAEPVTAAPDAAPTPPDAAPPDAAPPDAAPPPPDAASPDVPPPTAREVRAALRTAEKAISTGRGEEEARAAAEAVTAHIRVMPDDEAKAEWNVRRSTMWRRLADRQTGDARKASLLAARTDLVAAMTYGPRTRNFSFYKKAVALTVAVHGPLTDETLAFACDDAHLGAYLHRRNHCSVLRIRAGRQRLESNPLSAAALICAGYDMFTADLPGLSDAQLKRKRSEWRDYGAQCNLARRALEPIE